MEEQIKRIREALEHFWMDPAMIEEQIGGVGKSVGKPGADPVVEKDSKHARLILGALQIANHPVANDEPACKRDIFDLTIACLLWLESE